MLETHYDNPKLEQGIRDNSGLNVFITPNLREHDASMLKIGHNVGYDQLIPPGVEGFRSIGRCTKECTEQVQYKSGKFSCFYHLLMDNLTRLFQRKEYSC